MTGFYNKGKRTVCATLILVILFAVCFYYYGDSFYALDEGKTNSVSEVKTDVKKNVSKDEVIYANLEATGNLKDLYVVNVLNLDGSGKAVDYGDYSKVVNLTDMSEIGNENGKILINSNQGKFYYEGYLENSEVPWIINIDYSLNEKDIEPENLAGESGDLRIRINTEENAHADAVFYNNYMLQISVPMDMEVADDIKSEGGTEALSGGTKLINYTVLPGSDGDFTLTSKVKDFHMESIQISAIPFSMDFDMEEMDELTGQFDTLADAMSNINSGTEQLDDGIGETNKGFDSLNKGSQKFNKGLKKINKGTKSIAGSSNTISDGIKTMSQSLNQSFNSGDMENMFNGLKSISAGLNDMSSGMKQMLLHINSILSTVPDYPETEVETLSNSVDQDAQVVAEYASKAGVFIKQYKAYADTLMAMSTSVGAISVSIDEISSGAEKLKSLSILQNGLTKLASDYNTFNSYLQSYCGGVDEIARSYSKLNSGISKTSKGLSQLSEGSTQLSDGMNLLTSNVNQIPDQVQEKIDSITGSGDDFDPVSFVSSKNKDVNTVQFVLSTDKIKKEKIVKEEVDDGKGKETIIDRILGLFK